MGLFNLFKDAEPSSSNDDRALSQIASADTVRTSEAITKFIPATAGQVQQAAAALRKREEQQKNFFKLLEIKQKHSKLDTEANTKLFQYLAGEQQEVTQRRLARYPLKIAIEQSRLAHAKAEGQLSTARSKVDAEIAALQQAMQDAGKQLKGGKR